MLVGLTIVILSNLVLFRNTGKVISEVDLLVNTGTSNSSVKLNSWSNNW